MKIIALLVCFLVAFAAASASTSNIKLDVFSGSNSFWLAVAVRNAGVDTASVQIQESGSNSWESLTFISGWGYWTSSSTKELDFPISVRLTSADRRQLTLTNIISSGSAGLVDTGAKYVPGTSPSTEAPAACPATPNPTSAATTKPTEAPATAAPTSAPTATHRPRPTSTTRPTSAPTSAPTTKAPTSAPTTKAPTSAPTTKAPTSAPTTKAPTSAPTTKAPTSAPTTKAPTTSAPTTKAPSTGCNGGMKLMVPLYAYPGSQWDTVAASGRVVPTLAIINPNSGPGNGPDSTYNSYMTKMNNAGVEMVGYVHTSYGSRSISDVKREIDIYATQFPLLLGIFLDEVSAESSKLSYYQQLYDYIMGMPGWKYDIINPGTVPVAGYANAATQIVSYESAASGFASSSNPSYASCNNKDKFAMITYGASSSVMQTAISAAKSKGIYGWVYVTSTAGTGATYNSLPSYYASMASYIASLN